MDQEPLWVEPVNAVALSCWLEDGRGWFLTIAYKRGGESWGKGTRSTYHSLNTAELYDVICADVAVLLDL